MRWTICRPNNYTTVWACRGKGMPQKESFRRASHHDSAWRHDGFKLLSETYSALRRTLRERLPEGYPIKDSHYLEGITRVDIAHQMNTERTITTLREAH